MKVATLFVVKQRRSSFEARTAESLEARAHRLGISMDDLLRQVAAHFDSGQKLPFKPISVGGVELDSEQYQRMLRNARVVGMSEVQLWAKLVQPRVRTRIVATGEGLGSSRLDGPLPQVGWP